MALATEVDVANAALMGIGEESITAFSDATDRARVVDQLYDTVLDEVLSKTFWGFGKRYLPLALSNPVPLTIPAGFTLAYDLPGDFIRPVRLVNSAKFDIYQDFATITDETPTLQSTGKTVDFSAAHGLAVDDYVVLTSGDEEDEIRRVVTVDDADTVTLDVAFTADQAALTTWKSAKGDKLYLITDEGSAKLEYIARVTDPTKWTPMFTKAFIKRLQSDFALAITHSRNLSESLLQEYAAIVAEAEAISGQSANRPRQIYPTTLVDVRRGGFRRNDRVMQLD